MGTIRNEKEYVAVLVCVSRYACNKTHETKFKTM